MGHSNTAEALLKAVQGMIDMALRPFDEQERRTAGLLAQTRDEIGRDRQANHETEREWRACIHALASRIELLESGRTGARIELLKPQAERKGPPPGVPSIPQTGGYHDGQWYPAPGQDPTTDAIRAISTERNRLRSELDAERERRAAAEQAGKVAASQRDEKQHVIVQRNTRINELTQQTSRLIEQREAVEKLLAETRTERDGYKDGQERMTKARDAALKGCDELGAQVTKLQRERDELQRDLKAAQDRARILGERAQAAEQQLQRRQGLDERRLQRLAELEGREQATADLVTAAQTFEATVKDMPMPSAVASPLVAAICTMTASVKEYNRKLRGEPEPEDCQAGTCDCPSRPGTYDIAHRDGCPEACTCGPLAVGESHKIGCPEMPF